MVDQSWSISTGVCQISRYINILVVEILRWFHVTPTWWKAILEVIKGHWNISSWCPQATWNIPYVVHIVKFFTISPRYGYNLNNLWNQHLDSDRGRQNCQTIIDSMTPAREQNCHCRLLGVTISCRKKKQQRKTSPSTGMSAGNLEMLHIWTKVLIIITHLFVGLGSVFPYFRRPNPSRTKNNDEGQHFNQRGDNFNSKGYFWKNRLINVCSSGDHRIITIVWGTFTSIRSVQPGIRKGKTDHRFCHSMFIHFAVTDKG